MKRSLDIAAIAMTSLLLLAFAVLSLRGLIDPQTASARFGTPVSDIAGSLFYRVYLSRQSRHRRVGRDFPALAAMDAAGRPSDGHRRAAGVRHVGAVAERDNAAGVSSDYAGVDRDHGRAALAARGREPDLIRRAESRSDLSPAAKVTSLSCYRLRAWP